MSRMTAKTVQIISLMRIVKIGRVYPRLKTVRPLQLINPAIWSPCYNPTCDMTLGDDVWVRLDDFEGFRDAPLCGGADGGGRKIPLSLW
jgi:hypothetical protein